MTNNEETISELLREIADKSKNKDLVKALNNIATCIDLELERQPLATLDEAISAEGWVERNNGESLQQYIKRCFVPRYAQGDTKQDI